MSHTDTNNYLYDTILRKASPNAFKVVCAVLRNTVGRGKGSAEISMSRFRKLAGIASNSTLNLAIEEAIKNKWIERNVSTRTHLYRVGAWCGALDLDGEWPESNESCFVYLIHSSSGHHKIGISNNPKKRLSDLARQSTLTPFELELMEHVRLDSKKEALVLERNLHKRYKHYRIRGEWFELPHKAVSDILDIYDWRVM